MSINGKTMAGSVRTWGGKRSHKRGGFGSKYIRRIVKNNREYILHATKGWRSFRLTNDR